MLDNGDRQGEIARWIFSLPCHVQFPPKLREELERTGAVPVPSDDVRRHRRIFCRGDKHRARWSCGNRCPRSPARPRGNASLPATSPKAVAASSTAASSIPASGCEWSCSPAQAPRGSGLVPPAGQDCYAAGGEFVTEPSEQPVES